MSSPKSEDKRENDPQQLEHVTARWLWQNVPAKFWLSLITLLGTVFLGGVATGQVTLFQKIIERYMLRETPVVPYEIIQYDKVPWRQLISEAKFQLVANGVVLTQVDPGQIVSKVKKDDNFKATLIMMKPDGQAIEARARDENMYRNPAKIAQKFLAFRELSNKELNQEEQTRLLTRYVDVYPTIAVTIIDNDLYAYFYPQGDIGLTSPVIKIKDYQKASSSEGFSAAFFEKHLQSLIKLSNQPTETDYKKYEKIRAGS